MANTRYGMYKGHSELEPGKMIYRHKGSFASEKRARACQQRLAAEGKRARVIRMVGEDLPFHVECMAKHEFWKRNFILDRRK